jgi:hypothetical protein
MRGVSCGQGVEITYARRVSTGRRCTGALRSFSADCLNQQTPVHRGVGHLWKGGLRGYRGRGSMSNSRWQHPPEAIGVRPGGDLAAIRTATG